MPDDAPDLLQELQDKLPKAKDALERKRFGHILSDVLNDIAEVDRQIPRVAALSKATELLTDFVSDRQRQEMIETLDEIWTVAEHMEKVDSKDGLEAIHRDYKTIEKQYISNLNRTVRDVLIGFERNRIRPLGHLGQLLQRLGQKELGTRLQALKNEAERTESLPTLKWPDHIQKLEAEALNLKSEMTNITKNKEIDEFLFALSSGKTTLKMVTPAVLQWLREQSALDEFQVTSV